MNDELGFRISQGLDVLTPKSGAAYPISCDEWDFLKTKLRQVSAQPLLYQTLGSLLTGAGISMLVTLLLGTLPPLTQSPARVIAGAVMAVEIFCGAVCFLFASQHRKLRLVQVSDVIMQMELIERRYGEQTLTILSAKYGIADHQVDVTTELNGGISHGRLRLLAGNHLKGDPAPNLPKQLVVRYSHDGRELEKTVNEGIELNIP